MNKEHRTGLFVIINPLCLKIFLKVRVLHLVMVYSTTDNGLLFVPVLVIALPSHTGAPSSAKVLQMRPIQAES